MKPEATNDHGKPLVLGLMPAALVVTGPLLALGTAVILSKLVFALAQWLDR